MTSTEIYSKQKVTEIKKVKDPKHIFHLVSYLQYPFMAGSMYFYVYFILSVINRQPDWSQLNYVLVLVGVAFSFSTLQNTAKVQNKLSRKIWEDPLKGKIALGSISFLAFSMIAVGLLSFYLSENEVLESIAIGITVLGIGLVGVLKSAIEMFENHRQDNKALVSSEGA